MGQKAFGVHCLLEEGLYVVTISLETGGGVTYSPVLHRIKWHDIGRSAGGSSTVVKGKPATAQALIYSHGQNKKYIERNLLSLRDWDHYYSTDYFHSLVMQPVQTTGRGFPSSKQNCPGRKLLSLFQRQLQGLPPQIVPSLYTREHAMESAQRLLLDSAWNLVDWHKQQDFSDSAAFTREVQQIQSSLTFKKLIKNILWKVQG